MTDDALVSKLAAIDLFQGLSDKVIRHIASEGKTTTFPAGATVTEEGASVSGWAPFSPDGVCFYVILDGSADVAVHGEHRATLGSGSYFGETSLVDHEPRTATVTAGPDGMRAFALTAWAFAPILAENPSVMMALLKVITKRLRAAEARA
jgi:CRP/FNR family transcriptional regulator, cyclic AMP receptor protein